MVLVKALLDDASKRRPQLIVIFGLLAGKIFQFLDDAGGQGLANLGDLRIVLQHLARNIERHILAVDNAAHETQVAWQEFRSIRNEDTAYIELYMTFAG